MARVELKYVLSSRQYYQLRERILFIAGNDSRDTHIQRYPVFTAYFDSSNGEAYHDKLEGEYTHEKLRLRRYTSNFFSPGDVFLEAKCKEDSRGTKHRVQAPFNRALISLFSWLGKKLPLPLESLLLRRPLDRICNVYYWREAYHLGTISVKFNFDTHLLALFEGEFEVTETLLCQRGILYEGEAIFEIKSEGSEFPGWLMEELRQVGAVQSSFSKYQCAVDFLGLGPNGGGRCG